MLVRFGVLGKGTPKKCALPLGLLGTVGWTPRGVFGKKGPSRGSFRSNILAKQPWT